MEFYTGFFSTTLILFFFLSTLRNWIFVGILCGRGAEGLRLKNRVCLRLVFTGLQCCFGHSFAISPSYCFMRDFWIRTTEWQQPLSGVHSTMMEKLAQACEGGVFTLFTTTYKVVVYAPAERVDHRGTIQAPSPLRSDFFWRRQMSLPHPESL